MDSAIGTGEVCANIGPKERQKRLISGGASLAVAVVGFVVARAFALPAWASLFTFPFFVFAAFGFFQWKDRTCVANARRGVINMDKGDVNVTDAAMTAAINTQSRQVQLKSLLAAVGATAVCVILSVLK